MREYMARNPDKAERAALRKRQRRATDFEWAEKDRMRSAAYTTEHVEENRARALTWQRENKEQYTARQDRLAKEQSAARVVKTAKWKKENPDKAQANAVESEHRRRSRKLSGDASSCSAIIRHWKAQPSFRCCLCGVEFPTKGNLHVDHVIPLAKGGVHEVINLQRLCKSCNLRKGASLPDNYTA